VTYRDTKKSHVYLQNHELQPNWVWWDKEAEIYERLTKSPCLHVCSGKSDLGDVRIDLDPTLKPNIVADMNMLPIRDRMFESAIIDPPYYYKAQRDAMRYLYELKRVARKVILIHKGLPLITGMKLLGLRIIKQIPGIQVKIVSIWENDWKQTQLA